MTNIGSPPVKRKLWEDYEQCSQSQPIKSEYCGESSDDCGEPSQKRARTIGNSYLEWDSDQFCSYLRDNGIDEDALFKIGTMLDGKSLPTLTEESLVNLGIDDEETRQAVMKWVHELVDPTPTPDYKVFNDSIHGHIEMHPLLVAIIDTPEFQRLRWIKQLGIAYLVYPGASHNRFEHSLGVAHLAGVFARSLQSKQPELNITAVDILCVEMAGLCHDLGHGPFSHIFDNKFIPRVSPKKKSDWKHEQASLQMFEHLIDKNQLRSKLTEYEIGERDITFVKEMIIGPLKKDGIYHGRTKKKHFLYEIVANKRTAIDVDKWDYLARDCHHLGIKSTFDHRRYIYFARVISHKSEKGDTTATPRICCRDKEANTLYMMFQSRANLHMMAYQHKTNQNLENMLLIAMEKANEHLRFEGKDGKKFKLADCIKDMEAYARLTDNIFMDILNSTDPKLRDAQKILHDMQRRKFFKFIAETRPRQGADSENLDELSETTKCKNEIAKICETLESESNPDVPLDARTKWDEELILQRVVFDFGMGGKNPINKVLFYKKHDLHTAFHQKQQWVSMMLPQNFNESRLRLYCKSSDPDVHSIASDGFAEWCNDNNHVEPKLMAQFTPMKNTQSSQVPPSPRIDHRRNLALKS